MNGELVSTVTSDFVRLHGFYTRSDARLSTTPETGSVDAAVLIHGLGSNFYSSRLLMHVAQTLVELGTSVVIVNTRGHDMINTLTWNGRARSVGAALENVGDAKFDVSAWAEFLVQRGHSNVLVLGHSLGAIKALYAHANNPHPKIRSIIGLSATRLSYSNLIGTKDGAPFTETIQRCQQLIEENHGDQPIHVKFPFPTWMTPQCYVEKYGPAETYNWLNFIDQVDIPTLLVFGQKELDNNAAFDGLRTELNELQSDWNSFTIEEIPEADHFYTSKFTAVDDVVSRWLTR